MNIFYGPIAATVYVVYTLVQYLDYNQRMYTGSRLVPLAVFHTEEAAEDAKWHIRHLENDVGGTPWWQTGVKKVTVHPSFNNTPFAKMLMYSEYGGACHDFVQTIFGNEFRLQRLVSSAQVYVPVGRLPSKDELRVILDNALVGWTADNKVVAKARAWTDMELQLKDGFVEHDAMPALKHPDARVASANCLVRYRMAAAFANAYEAQIKSNCTNTKVPSMVYIALPLAMKA